MQSLDIEFQSPAAIRAFQEDLLRRQIAYLAEHSPFYRRLFAEHDIDPAQVRTLDDLTRLPFTEKEHLQRFNDDFICCDRADIIDYITTSGTTGESVTFACTDADLERLALNEAKSFAMAGVGRESIVQLMTTLDKRFMAGMAYFLGLRRLGAGIIRVGNGIPELQWETIRRIIGIGEGLRDQEFRLNLLGSRIHEKWPEVQLFATYSSTEMGATFAECSEGCGGHVHPELIIVEIIGEDNRPVADGETGEVVVTTLGVEAMPLLRFRTGDMAKKCTERCTCGRHAYRLTPLIGRKHNMIKLKGTTLYPPAVNDVLDHADYVENYMVIVQDSAAGTDEVVVRIGLREASPEAQRLLAAAPGHTPDLLIKDLKDRFRSRLRVAPLVEICPIDEIAHINFPAKSRKPVKFIDRRTHP